MATVQSVIDDFLRRAREGPGPAVVVRARPGRGRSWLLRRARDTAGRQGIAVCWPAHGDELLRALANFSGQGPGSVLLVDDVEQLDAAELEALTSALGRVPMLLTARLGAALPPKPGRVDIVELPAPAAPEVRGMLGERADLATESVIAALLALGHAHPLAVAELCATASDEQLRGREPLPRRAPLGPASLALLRAQRAGLPAPARVWLLLLALGEGNLPLCTRAGQTLGLTLADLAPAERMGLVRASLGTGVTWPEPLTPVAVVQDATAADSERVCRALAETSSPVSEPVNHPRWLAGALGQSQDASRALGAAVLALAEAGRLEEAYDLACRAAEVASDPVVSLGHRVTAAELCWIAGYGDHALRLLDELPGPLPPGNVAASASVLRTVISGVRDSWSASPALEVPATHVPYGPGQLERSVGTAVLAGWESAPPDWLSSLVKRLCLAYGVSEAAQPVSAAEVIAAVISGDSNPPAEHRAGLLAGSWWHHGDDPVHPKTWPPPLLPVFIGEEAGYAARFSDVLSRPRISAARTTRALVQLKLGTAQAFLGRWDEGLASTSACVSLAQELQLGALQWDALVNAAWIHACRGDEQACTQALRLAEQHQVLRADGQPPWYVCWSWGLLQLSLGRPGEAYEWLLPVQSGRVGSPKDHAIRRLSTADFVEAAVRAGHAGEAEAALARFAEWAGPHPADWVRLDQAMASATVAADTDPDTAQRNYESALELCSLVGRRAVTAKAEFSYGSWLRRSRRRQEARPHLRVAEDLFAHLGAIPSRDRAHAERRASGEVGGVSEQPDAPHAALTAQEYRIARAAANGRSNREIAEALGLSPRTVGYHLYKIFPKLDITSRAQLAAALEQPG